MAKAKRKQKLKVYCTPIGFHNALVAAPSQKAALEAWGSDTNLFARGAAEQIADPALAKVALEHPGQVVKVLRGTQAEQLAALEKQKPLSRTKPPEVEVVPKGPKKRPPKPSKSALEKAEAVAEKLEKRQAAEIERLEKQQKALEREIRETRRRQERERDQAQERVERERTKYERGLRR